MTLSLKTKNNNLCKIDKRNSCARVVVRNSADLK